jgi:hypothetical protein
VSTNTATLQGVASVDEFLNVVTRKTVPLSGHLCFKFLRDHDVFDRLVEQAAIRGLLDATYTIDSTHITAIQYNDPAS